MKTADRLAQMECNRATSILTRLLKDTSTTVRQMASKAIDELRGQGGEQQPLDIPADLADIETMLVSMLGEVQSLAKWRCGSHGFGGQFSTCECGSCMDHRKLFLMARLWNTIRPARVHFVGTQRVCDLDKFDALLDTMKPAGVVLDDNDLGDK